jgi:hypothetical protein
MKFLLRSLTIVTTSFIGLSTQVLAQGTAATILNGETVFKRVIDTVFNPLYELVVGLAIVYFMYGVAKFIYDINDPEKKTTGKQHLLWGSIGLFIILSVGGILPLINGILGGMFQF